MPAARVDASRCAGVCAVSARPIPDRLTWRVVDDILGVPGWTLSVGYTYDVEPGDAPDVWIHAAEINTGLRVIPLAVGDLPNTPALEAIVAEQIEDELLRAAPEPRDPRDDGDYSFDWSLYA